MSEAVTMSMREELSRVLAWAAAAPQACTTQTDPIVARTIDTPLGPMIAAASRDGLCLLEFADRPSLEREAQDLARLLSRPFVADPTVDHSSGTPSAPRSTADSEHDQHGDGARIWPGIEHLALVERELAAYFAGESKDFTVTLSLPGSPFERRVWAALQRIPFGETTSYGRLAFRLGSPGAARAVGRANGRNRVSIVVPCHRVVHEDGTLCGYGGGLHRKAKLLDLERDVEHQGRLFSSDHATVA